MLVVEDADQIAESEFVKIACRARRWVLVGQCPLAEGNFAAESRPGLSSTRSNAANLAGRPASLLLARVSAFHRLWLLLHCEPRQLPYNSLPADECLCC